jgi:hypothetical protein
LNGALKVYRIKVILSLISVSATMALAICAGICLGGPSGEENTLAFAKEIPPPLLYNDDDIKQSDLTLNDEGTAEIFPLSSGSYDYSGSRGISVQQNVTQQNVCSSNTAYCYNEVDNDFNVNPP